MQKLSRVRKRIEKIRNGEYDLANNLVYASELRQYMYCPRKIYYYRVMGLKKVMSVKMAYGKEVHKEISERRNQGSTIERYHDVFLMDEDLGLAGYIDEIRWFDGEPKLVEYKTGTTPEEGIRLPDLIQTAALVMLAEEAYNIQINRVVVHYLKSNEQREIQVGIMERLKVIEVIEKIQKMVQTQEFPAVEKTPKCRDCEFRRRCWWEY